MYKVMTYIESTSSLYQGEHRNKEVDTKPLSNGNKTFDNVSNNTTVQANTDFRVCKE